MIPRRASRPVNERQQQEQTNQPQLNAQTMMQHSSPIGGGFGSDENVYSRQQLSQLPQWDASRNVDPCRQFYAPLLVEFTGSVIYTLFCMRDSSKLA